MKIIKIIEMEPINKGEVEKGIFSAQVVFPSENVYPVTVKDPFLEPGTIETNQEERLRWYFEEHMHSPFTDIERRKRAEKSITLYGESLFNCLFADADALSEWRNLAGGSDRLQFQVISLNPGFHALHWEAVKDPKQGKPLCLQGIEMIHTSGKPTLPYRTAESACLNLLMVTARPFGKQDIEYRTITRPVLEMIEAKRLRVEVHLLRPPTFRHLQEHLRQKKGFYHIVHLDMHGSVMSFDQYRRNFFEENDIDIDVPGFVKKRSGGRRDLEPYKGTKAFLFLVDDEGFPDPVSADETAELLHEAHVPICFLDACRTAMMTAGGEDDRAQAQEASLAMTLLEKGVRLVLGNAWSVTVTGAKTMMTQVYSKLLGEEELVRALNSGRLNMFSDRSRAVSGRHMLALEDWLLPVIWGKGDFNIRLKKEGVEERIAVQKRKQAWEAETEGMRTTGTYGFLGRDVDILQVESLLQRHKILLLRGMGGTGKTTLLGHMALWWWNTGWIEHAFYFGYDKKPYRAEEILNRIAEAVLPREDFGRFLVMPSLEMKAVELAGFLKEGRTTPGVLLILDNLESVTGAERAVGSKLAPAERKDLVKVLRCLMGSSMKILLGSRAPEDWLAAETFKHSVYRLEGLDKSSRFALAREILKRNRLNAGDWQEFGRLLEILAGYPLAMEILLPNLALRTAKELCEMLTGAGVDMQGEQISEEIFKCIDISFSLLTDRARSSLLAFAPFTSFLNAMVLKEYLGAIQDEGLFKGTALADLEGALSQAENQGLVKEELPKCYALQPVFPFFLWQQVLREHEGPGSEGAVALARAFCRYMSKLAELYDGLMESKESEERQIGQYLFKQDRENLQKALDRVLAEQGDFYNLYILFANYYNESPNHNEAIEWMEGVVEKLDGYADASRDAGFLARYAHVLGNLGSQYFNIKDYAQAKEKHKQALELYEKAGRKQEMAVGYHQLGMVAEEGRDFAEAKRCYLEALKIFQEFNDRHPQATVYHQLGMVAEEGRDFAEAKRCYQEEMKILQEFNDRYSQASTYHQLGRVAEGERDFAEARSCYQEEMKILQEFNDRYSQARTYHQLGMVAKEEQDFAEAKRCYLEEMKICQDFNDRYGQASTYHQLGRVAKEEQDFAEALRDYSLALEIWLQYNDEYHAGMAKRNLGRLFTAWQAPASAIEGLELSSQVKEIIRAIREKIEEKPGE